MNDNPRQQCVSGVVGVRAFRNGPSATASGQARFSRSHPSRSARDVRLSQSREQAVGRVPVLPGNRS